MALTNAEKDGLRDVIQAMAPRFGVRPILAKIGSLTDDQARALLAAYTGNAAIDQQAAALLATKTDLFSLVAP